MSSGIIMRNGIQYGNAVLNKADEILTDDNKTVQDELNTLKTSLNWTNIAEINIGATATVDNLSKYRELMCVPLANSVHPYSPIVIPIAESYFYHHFGDSSANSTIRVSMNKSNNTITIGRESLTGWSSLVCRIYAR